MAYGTDFVTNISIASINWSTSVGYLGKKGNSGLTNWAYGFGAMGNLQDIVAGIQGSNIQVNSRKELAGHSWIEGEDINISFGPGDVDSKPGAKGLKWESQYLFKTVKGRNFVTNYTYSTKPVNVSKLQKMTNFLDKGLSLSGKQSLKYGVWNGCVNQTSRALLKSGVFNFNAFLPITSPVLLNAELALRNYGMMFSHYLTYY